MNFMNLATILTGNALEAMTPLLFAAMGGLFTELSGALSIALEGYMMLGAFVGVVAAASLHSVIAGLCLAALASAALAWVSAKATLGHKANIFITGLGTNLLVAGLLPVLSQHFFGTKSVLSFTLPAMMRPFSRTMASVPFLGQAFFSHSILVYVSWLTVLAAWGVLYKTPVGRRIRACGSQPEALRDIGRKPENYQIVAAVVAGASSWVAGACLSLPLSAYVPNISSGRGWIALVAIYLGSRRPGRIMLACFIFALAEGFSNYAQGFLQVPSEFVLAIPYAASLVALILGSLSRRRQGDWKDLH